MLVAVAVVMAIGGQAVRSRGESGYSHSRFTGKDARHVLAKHCALLPSTAEFPNRLKAAFAALTKQNQFALANPTDNYQATDFVEDPKLPIRRLVIAGNCEGFWFIHYEQGGRGHSYAVVLFKDDKGGQPAFVWGGRGGARSNTPEEIRNAISDGLISDSLPFYW